MAAVGEPQLKALRLGIQSLGLGNPAGVEAEAQGFGFEVGREAGGYGRVKGDGAEAPRADVYSFSASHIPAQAGMTARVERRTDAVWVPAYAGMTSGTVKLDNRDDSG